MARPRGQPDRARAVSSSALGASPSRLALALNVGPTAARPATLRSMAARRSRRPKIVISVLAGLVVLLVGIWLGGHSSWLPSPLRSAFVDKSDDPLVNQVVDLLQRDYYRPLTRSQLVNKGLAGMVASLNDPYSHYYDPSAYQGFLNQSNPHLSGIGVDVIGEARGLRV